MFDGKNWVEMALPPNAIKPTPKTIVRKYVVAGNYTEYKRWLSMKGLSPHEYVYVAGVDGLYGIKDPHGYFVGSWQGRSDIDEIQRQIQMGQMA